jgi:hypothetical protein
VTIWHSLAMSQVQISGGTYILTSDATYDYASNSGIYYYYRVRNTTQWYPYPAAAQTDDTTTQSHEGGSSSNTTVPAQYSYRLASDSYHGTIGKVEIRWGPAAKQRLLEETPLKGVSVETMKALTEHFTYLMAARVGATRVVIKCVLNDKAFYRHLLVGV